MTCYYHTIYEIFSRLHKTRNVKHCWKRGILYMNFRKKKFKDIWRFLGIEHFLWACFLFFKRKWGKFVFDSGLLLNLTERWESSQKHNCESTPSVYFAIRQLAATYNANIQPIIVLSDIRNVFCNVCLTVTLIT